MQSCKGGECPEPHTQSGAVDDSAKRVLWVYVIEASVWMECCTLMLLDPRVWYLARLVRLDLPVVLWGPHRQAIVGGCVWLVVRPGARLAGRQDR